MINTITGKSLSFILAISLVASSSVEAKFNIYEHKTVAATLLALVVYRAYKTEPSHSYDLSLEALKKNPIAWLENAIGNRAIPDARYGGQLVLGQQGRGLLGWLDGHLENAGTILLLLTALKGANDGLNEWLSIFDCKSPVDFTNIPAA